MELLGETLVVDPLQQDVDETLACLLSGTPESVRFRAIEQPDALREPEECQRALRTPG